MPNAKHLTRETVRIPVPNWIEFDCQARALHRRAQRRQEALINAVAFVVAVTVAVLWAVAS